MPIPGRDTPEDSPESSIDNNVPTVQDHQKSGSYDLSDDSDAAHELREHGNGKADLGNHKRKAGRHGSGGQQEADTSAAKDVEEEEDDDG